MAARDAADVAAASGGRLDRARLLAGDQQFAARREAWRSVPYRLDGSGAAAAVIAAELVEVLASAAVVPLEARHAVEREALEERAARSGERGSGRKELAEQHKRELRRLRLDELRFGLATIAAEYRSALVASPTPAAGAANAGAVTVVHEAVANLVRNPSETLLLQALLLRLPPLRPAAG